MMNMIWDYVSRFYYLFGKNRAAYESVTEETVVTVVLDQLSNQGSGGSVIVDEKKADQFCIENLMGEFDGLLAVDYRIGVMKVKYENGAIVDNTVENDIFFHVDEAYFNGKGEAAALRAVLQGGQWRAYDSDSKEYYKKRPLWYGLLQPIRNFVACISGPAYDPKCAWNPLNLPKLICGSERVEIETTYKVGKADISNVSGALGPDGVTESGTRNLLVIQFRGMCFVGICKNEVQLRQVQQTYCQNPNGDTPMYLKTAV